MGKVETIVQTVHAAQAEKETPVKKTEQDEGAERPKLFNHHAMTNLMKDIKAMDMVITFAINGGAQNVALWAHKAVLDQ